MTRLSTDPMTPHLAGQEYGKWSTFTVFARVVPDLANGKRFEYVGNLAKIANRVEDVVREINDSSGALVNVPGPVMFTPQFGQNPTRLTITGFFRSSHPVASPLTDRTVDHDNRVMTGPSSTGGTLRDGTDPTANNDDDVGMLKAILEAMSPDLNDIFRIEFNGVLYGTSGRSFP